MAAKARPLFDPEIVMPAIVESFKKLNPVHMWKNPVMFVTEVGAALTTMDLFFTKDSTSRSWRRFHCGSGSRWSSPTSPRPWPKAAARPRPMRCARAAPRASGRKLMPDGKIQTVPAESLRKGDIFVVEANELIAADGEIIEGAASVNESAITGESAPVIREAGGDRSAVTGGTTVLSDRSKSASPPIPAKASWTA
jgi:potassium-transporting ATPase ATP-binding subunit